MNPEINQTELTEILSKISDDPQLCRDRLNNFINIVAINYAIKINKSTGSPSCFPETTSQTYGEKG